jgi:hypothetical protein
MGWTEKDQPTPFDNLPLPGLFFLDGDVLARLVHRNWTAGQKLPMVTFPSGQEFELWEASHPDAGGIVHIFGEIDLPYKGTRDDAFEHAENIAEACGYSAQKVGEQGLKVRGQDPDENFLITYDPDSQQIHDIAPQRTTEPPPVHRAHQLMTGDIREQLPELYSNEEIGLEALAPIKYFTPDSGWTWYASEFDGEDLFFGLVIGFEIELGYFSLRELQQTRGPLGLKIERDLYYEPKSLRELQDQHRRERGE